MPSGCSPRAAPTAATARPRRSTPRARPRRRARRPSATRARAATPPCPRPSRTPCACASRDEGADGGATTSSTARVAFDHAQLDDWILVRTDGTPTYNFCVVVDDVTMKHHPRHPRQRPPVEHARSRCSATRRSATRCRVFAHIPMILGADKSRLSKRHGATSVQAFRDAGILPEAMVNYLARLGWSHGDQEIFSARRADPALRPQAHVGAAGAVFDQAKLEWLSITGSRPRRRAPGRRPRRRSSRASGPARRRRTAPGSRAWWTRCGSARRRSSRWSRQAAFYLRAPGGVRAARPTAKFWTAEARPSATRSSSGGSRPTTTFTAPALEALYRDLAADARAQAGRPGPAHAHRAHRPHGEPADLRRARASSASAETLARLRRRPRPARRRAR